MRGDPLAFRSHTRARCDETEAVLREPNDRARGTRGRVVRRSSAWEQRPNEEREREAATWRGNYYAERGTSESYPREAGGDSRAHCRDRRSTRLNSSHVKSSYAVFCSK